MVLTTWLDDLLELFKLPVPGGSPGEYYMPVEGDVAVKKQLALRSLPVVEYTDWGTYYVPKDTFTYGNVGLGPVGQSYPSGIHATSLYDWSQQTAKRAGADMSVDPLGVNYVAQQQGGGPVVQYKKLQSIGLPDWYPTPAAPGAMSGASIIYENGRPARVISASGTRNI